MHCYLRTMHLYIRLVWGEFSHFRASRMVNAVINSVEGRLQIDKVCAIKSTIYIKHIPAIFCFLIQDRESAVYEAKAVALPTLINFIY